MTAKPKPLTRAEWERGPVPVMPDAEWVLRMDALIDALFRYRERTRGMFDPGRRNGDADDTDQIAAELGIE